MPITSIYLLSETNTVTSSAHADAVLSPSSLCGTFINLSSFSISGSRASAHRKYARKQPWTIECLILNGSVRRPFTLIIERCLCTSKRAKHEEEFETGYCERKYRVLAVSAIKEFWLESFDQGPSHYMFIAFSLSDVTHELEACPGRHMSAHHQLYHRRRVLSPFMPNGPMAQWYKSWNMCLAEIWAEI